MSKKIIENLFEDNEKMFEDYEKMQLLRRVGKSMPNSHLQFALETVDRKWDEITKELQPPKKKSFVTKF